MGFKEEEIFYKIKGVKLSLEHLKENPRLYHCYFTRITILRDFANIQKNGSKPKALAKFVSEMLKYYHEYHDEINEYTTYKGADLANMSIALKSLTTGQTRYFVNIYAAAQALNVKIETILEAMKSDKKTIRNYKILKRV